MKLFTVAFLLLIATQPCQPSNPGLILHTTQRAVTYGVGVAVEVLSQFLNGYKLVPDQAGSISFGSYTINNINVRQFTQTVQNTHLNFAPPHGLLFAASEINVQLAADYYLSIKVPFIGTYNTSGSFSISANDVGLSLGADFSVDSGTGHVVAASNGCTANVGSLIFHFQPGLDSILHTLANVLTPVINFGLNQGLCRAMGLIVNQMVDPLLLGVPLKLPLIVNFNNSLALPPLNFEIDYGFLQAPNVGVAFAEAEFKGQVYAPGHQYDPGQPVAPPVVSVSDPPPAPLTGAMVVFQLSDYILNTFGFAAFRSGVTAFTINSAILSAMNIPSHFLQTCCTDMQCIGGIIPSVCAQYPNGSVEISLTPNTFSPPSGHTSTSGTIVEISGFADFLVRTNPSTATKIFRASVQTRESISNLRINGYTVAADVTTTNARLALLSTTIGAVSDTLLQQAWTAGVSTVWDTLLNQVVHSGLSLPALPCFNIVNGRFRDDLNNVQVGVDIQFVGVKNCPFIPQMLRNFHKENERLIRYM